MKIKDIESKLDMQKKSIRLEVYAQQKYFSENKEQRHFWQQKRWICHQQCQRKKTVRYTVVYNSLDMWVDGIGIKGN